MSQSYPRAEFSNVDAASDPRELIGVLDVQHAQAFKQQYKARTLALLDLHAGQRVLDAGSGVGIDALAMARMVAPDGEVVGFDASQTMVREARERSAGSGLPVSFVQGDIHALPFPDHSFDRAYVDRTFQHLAHPEQALAQLVRVTKPGGRLLIVEPDHETRVIDSPYLDVTRRFLRFRSDTLAQGGIAHRLYAMFRDQGLTDVAVEAMTEIYTDYAAVNGVMHFDGGLRLAAEHGVVSDDEAEQWIRYIEEAARSGRFFSAVTYFITTGNKPA